MFVVFTNNKNMQLFLQHNFYFILKSCKPLYIEHFAKDNIRIYMWTY